MSVATSDRLFTPAFIALTLSELAYFTAGGLVIGVTPLFVTGPLGSDAAALGLVAGAYGVTTLLLRPYAGRLSAGVPTYQCGEAIHADRSTLLRGSRAQRKSDVCQLGSHNSRLNR